MNQKAQKALDKIVQLFKTGNVPEALSIVLLPNTAVPSASWSFGNRLLMFLNNTSDARGFRQWQQVGRSVKKGSKAFAIICPSTAIKENQYGEKETIVLGFRTAPVFKVEDTEGKELQVEHLPPKELPPLYHVAEQWNLTINWKSILGSFGTFSSEQKAITLATYDENVFFHELAHAAHEKLLDNAVKTERWREEIVAELTAAVLGQLYGKQINLGDQYKYIADYAGQADLNAYHACMVVVTDVGKCLDLIVAEEEIQQAA